MKRFIGLIIIVLFLPYRALAVVSLSVSNEKFTASKIAFFGFDSPDGKKIFKSIKGNLDSAGLFKVVLQGDIFQADPVASAQQMILHSSPTTAITPILSADTIPDFTKYNAIQINAIVVGQFSYNANGNLEAKIRMWDVLDQRQFFGKFYTASKDKYSKMANTISDEIFKSVTGEKVGHFNSKIAYIAEVGPVKKRIKKIKTIDFNGKNNKTLTDGRHLVLTPVFSRDKKHIYHLRYLRGKPQIFSLNVANLRSKRVGGFKGTTFAASPHPTDSNLLLLSAIINGNSDIYEMDIAANVATRLTKSPAIDTTPSYSPNGKKIAFSSNRRSGQHIYLMESNGTSLKRLTFGRGTYAKPVWSPDGRTLAFTRIKGGRFYIGTIGVDGRGEKLLASGYLVEGAKWSPNGRYLIFSKKRGAYGRLSIPRLYVIDIVTGFEYEIPTPKGEGATDPDWR